MSTDSIVINRAPVLTLWATVVAMRLGYRPDEALSLGKAVAGHTAQAKGRNLGIYRPRKSPDGKPAPKAGIGEDFWVNLCGKNIPVKQTDLGVRAVAKDKPVDPGSVESYLQKAFGETLGEITELMGQIAASCDPARLNDVAFGLYEQFRPPVEHGVQGWGQKGKLDLSKLRKMGKSAPL